MKRNFFSAIILPLAFAAFLACTPRVSALMMADFEVGSGYASGNLLYGQQGWSGCASNTSRVTPDPLNSGYTFVMSGNQSAYIVGSGPNVPYLSFASVSAIAGDMGALTWLQAMPDSQGPAGSAGVWITNTGGSTPMGLLIYNGGNIGMSVNGTTYDSGYDATMGGGGTPTLNKIYRFTMEFNWADHKVTGYMANADGSGSVTLGTYAWDSGVLDKASDAASSWGIALEALNGVSGFDDIELIPEPTVTGLLGFGLAGLLLRRRRKV